MFLPHPILSDACVVFAGHFHPETGSERLESFLGELIAAHLGSQSKSPEELADGDVSDPGDHSLIEQCAL